MKHAMPARQELKARTVFNLLGRCAIPPGRHRHRSSGRGPSGRHGRLMAEALAALGLPYGFVVHGEGWPRRSLDHPTTVAYEIRAGVVTRTCPL